MGKLWIAGLGPGTAETITAETMKVLEQADKVILRTGRHPAAAGLSARGIRYTSCDPMYESGGSFPEIYETITDYVLEEAQKGGSVCYCVPGHPMVAEETVTLLLKKTGRLAGQKQKGLMAPAVEVEVLSAVSFLDAAFVALGIDPIQEKLTILDAACLYDGNRSGLLPLPDTSCLFAQVYQPYIAGELKLALLEEAAPEAEVWILHHAGIEKEEELIRCPLAELDHFKRYDHLTSVFLPYAINGGGAKRGIAASEYPLDSLVEVFRRLLGPGGCPWDQKQTHETLMPYLLEEANEALEAIREKDPGHLKEELGDVLMQIVFHCALAEKRGDFDVNDVIDGITEKMIRRHPHVFGEEKAGSPEEVMVLWQKIKEEEKRTLFVDKPEEKSRKKR